MSDQDQSENYFVKKAFFDHLLRQGFTKQHLEVYDEYFDFFLERLPGRIMEMDPQEIYQVALASVEDLDGDEVIEAFLALMEQFMGYYAERYEALHPEDEAEPLEDEGENEAGPSEEDGGKNSTGKDPGGSSG